VHVEDLILYSNENEQNYCYNGTDEYQSHKHGIEQKKVNTKDFVVYNATLHELQKQKEPNSC
jgi:hypothetical protein